MIGDGMGRAQLDAASLYAHGTTGALELQSLPMHGSITTASLSGTTDSAAAATTMATGALTLNGHIGVDAEQQPVETLVELAHRVGLAAGVVTTAYLPHATPGAFTAHDASRHNPIGIAADQVNEVRADVMLGGGALYYLPAGAGSARSDDGLIRPLQTAGYRVVWSGAELAAAKGDADRLVGLFAAEHMDYTVDRAPQSSQPTLTEMSLAALDVLDRHPDGFFLIIEGARIDMASHANQLERAVGDTLAFDQAVAAVRDRIGERDDVTLLVTADHECGGLRIEGASVAGELPPVAWRWGEHTNADVDVFGQGPGSEQFDGERRDFRWVHEVAAARLEGRGVVEPAPALVPDGQLGDLPHLAVEQTVATGFGAGFNQLDALRVGADARGLAIGIDGVFEAGANAVVILLDVDLGAGTGVAGLRGALTDRDGRADAILAAAQLEPPPVPGFGAELAVVSWGAIDPRRESLWGDAGLRGLIAPYGRPDDLAWYGVATNFATAAVARGAPAEAVAQAGFEVVVPWSSLYPDRAGSIPPGAVVGVAAVLVNDDGGYTSNQALPPFPAGAANPGRAPVALPGVVEIAIDPDGDGQPAVTTAPRVLPSR
jgi:alkaline phosphatase